MLALTATNQLARVTASVAGDIEVTVTYKNAPNPLLASSGITYVSDIPTNIAVTTPVTIIPSPAALQKNEADTITIRNNATASNVVTVDVFDGTDAAIEWKGALAGGESVVLDKLGVWTRYSANGLAYASTGTGSFAGRSVPFMKIGTASDAVGYWYSTSKDAGFPGAWAPGTPGLNGRNTDGTTAADNGCLLLANAVSGANYLTEIAIASNINQTHLFFDVLWVNSGLVITTTTAQAITMPTLPARDINGSTNGEGLKIGILCTAAVGLAAVASNATVSYTNSDGTAGRTATLSAVVGSQAPATPVIGTVIWFNLAAGDKGVRSIQSITLGTTWVSGTISLFVARWLKFVGTTIPNVSARALGKDSSSPGVRLYNGSCILHCMLTSATTATFLVGDVTVQEK